ncbi:MAG TPA: peptidase S41, partial [Candidatus Aminicenantes bacterium]|nr:peptidase S41 [Candidatus Aminicenantes bacterium]
MKTNLSRWIVFAAILAAALCPLAAQTKESPLWLRYPAISPDGQTILFCYQGDIYRVAATGGQAVPLTIGEAYDYSPVWSHDGQRIAFASDRFGNFDVFVMPAGGGEAVRLTWHSAADVPSSFSTDDQRVLFSSIRQHLVSNTQFPVSGFPQLYSVPVCGGQARLELPQSAIDAQVSPDG